jgi:hypothetical protein
MCFVPSGACLGVAKKGFLPVSRRLWKQVMGECLGVGQEGFLAFTAVMEAGDGGVRAPRGCQAAAESLAVTKGPTGVPCHQHSRGEKEGSCGRASSKHAHGAAVFVVLCTT